MSKSHLYFIIKFIEKSNSGEAHGGAKRGRFALFLESKKGKKLVFKLIYFYLLPRYDSRIIIFGWNDKENRFRIFLFLFFFLTRHCFN